MGCSELSAVIFDAERLSEPLPIILHLLLTILLPHLIILHLNTAHLHLLQIHRVLLHIIFTVVDDLLILIVIVLLRVVPLVSHHLLLPVMDLLIHHILLHPPLLPLSVLSACSLHRSLSLLPVCERLDLRLLAHLTLILALSLDVA